MVVRDGRDFSMLFIFQNFTYVKYVGGGKGNRQKWRYCVQPCFRVVCETPGGFLDPKIS